ncbi:MAG: CHASE2 domain-containing protein [Cyanothece sp. SIO2G6]|nr:CHASE2 domain-containing protein [Cyanothece sp. SIO2G6]
MKQMQPKNHQVQPSLDQSASDLFRSGLWSILPGVVSISVVVGLRLMGGLQGLEWAALDAGLRWRSPEPIDDHVVIIGINEADIQAVGTYPIPDAVLAQLLRQLQRYEALVIGVDLVRATPVEPGHDDLVAAFQAMDNVIGAKIVVPDISGTSVAAPAALPPDQVGFIDALLDADGHQRRVLLGAVDVEGTYRFSMAVRLASRYLQARDLDWGNGVRNPTAMRFGSTEFPVITPNSGGYIGVDAGGNQTLINFRSGPQPFRVLSLVNVLNGELEPEWVRDRVVLIGITAATATYGADIAQSNAVANTQIYGVEIQAHVTSQIINAALAGRSLLHSWADGWEYLWIIGWAGLGIGIGRLIQSPKTYGLVVIVTTTGLVGIGYGTLLLGWWLPTVPALILFLFNSVVLHSLYLYDQSLRNQLQDRQRVIDQTFAAIHNGPLQSLAQLMRQVDAPQTKAIAAESLPPERVSPERAQPELVQPKSVQPKFLQQELHRINRELREIYVGMQQEVVQGQRLYLQGGGGLDLSLPLHELLHGVYTDTLKRDFPHFQTIRVKVVAFEPLAEARMSTAQKRTVCRFLEEALCNVGKYAVGIKRLTVDCRYDGSVNVIRVVDNGIGLPPTNITNNTDTAQAQPHQDSGEGTRQAIQLAKWLGGTFERCPLGHNSQSPAKFSGGTRCELSWPPRRSYWRHPIQQLRSAAIAVFNPEKG